MRKIHKKTNINIIDTIGSIDDLIEKYNEINKKILDYLYFQYDLLITKKGYPFSMYFSCINGGVFKSSEYVEKSDYKLITIKNIDANGFNADEPTYIPYKEEFDKYKLNIGDILLTMTGAYLGRCGIVDQNNCYLNQRVLKIESTHKAFLYIFLKKNEQNIFSMGKGSAQPNLSLGDLKEFDVCHSIDAIKSFDIYNSLIEKIIINKRKIKELKDIKLKYLNIFFN